MLAGTKPSSTASTQHSKPLERAIAVGIFSVTIPISKVGFDQICLGTNFIHKTNISPFLGKEGIIAVSHENASISISFSPNSAS